MTSKINCINLSWCHSSLNKDTYHPAWQSEFDLWNRQGRKREPTPAGCSLTSSWTPTRNTLTHTHGYANNSTCLQTRVKRQKYMDLFQTSVQMACVILTLTSISHVHCTSYWILMNPRSHVEWHTKSWNWRLIQSFHLPVHDDLELVNIWLGLNSVILCMYTTLLYPGVCPLLCCSEHSAFHRHVTGCMYSVLGEQCYKGISFIRNNWIVRNWGMGIENIMFCWHRAEGEAQS